MDFLFYCRSGYEPDLLAEIEYLNAEKGNYGYAKFAKHSAHLVYSMPQVNVPTSTADWVQTSKLMPKFDSLIFARQKIALLGEVAFKTNDRIGEVCTYLSQLMPSKVNVNTASQAYFSDVFVEYCDTEEGKEIAKFCKKFVVPLRNKLRKARFLSPKPDNNKPYLHLIFNTSQACSLGISFPNDRSEHPLGIFRLKMPSDAPSRSTLKLEEAIKLFFTPKQEAELFTKGMRAVDLGACPGGWTYQLVQRKLVVEAVDHGLIDEGLMATGLVEYYPQDGFLYKPKEGNVDWLVCDMIEQPTRVSELILSWLESGKANAALFNLKLPMNKRHKVVEPILQKFKDKLKDRFGEIIIKAKHLYHNRDEITVLVIVNGQMVNRYKANKS